MRFTIVILVCVWLTPTAGAQSAEEFFHDGARLFVGGELNDALSVVEAGLQAAPGHPKLEALKQLIEEEEEQQSGAEGSQDQDEQQEQEQEQDSEQSDSQGNRNDSEREESDQQQEQPSDEGSPPSPDSSQPEEQDQSQSDQRQSSAAGQDSEELSRAQALRILQALQNEEEQLLREVQKVKGRARRVEKDW